MTESTSQTANEVERKVLARGIEERIPQVALPDGAKWVAHAPDCLDVMGGIAELTGSLTLSAPLAEGVHVVVAPRRDERIRIEVVDETASKGHPQNGRSAASEWALAVLYDGGGLIEPHLLGGRATLTCQVRLAVLSVAHALLRSGLTPHLHGGFTAAVAVQKSPALDCRQVAVVQAATAAALTQALGISCGKRQLADICRQAQCDALGRPVGMATHAAPLLADGGKLLQLCCRPFEVGESLTIPSGIAFVGIDCGARHSAADEKYCAARTAALMGREIIARLVAQMQGGQAWDGYLARVSVTDYVDQLRDRIPTKLKGALYLERFGPLADAHAKIDPQAVYKVRSRAEHHIYEDDRVRQFAERMARTARTGVGQALREAGELMYASHWSYGQRCGLGSIETDLLVNLLRQEGADRGVHGARISGPGAGGMVAVLLDDTPEAVDAVQRAMEAYQQRTGHTARLRSCAESGGGRLAVAQAD